MNETDIAACRALADRHCNRGLNDCRWYHGNWHLLKALGIVSTSTVHDERIAEMLKPAIGDQPVPRILLAGSADESLLDVAERACRGLGVDAELTALDMCRTPLACMESYASRHGLDVATRQTDILEFDTDERFDVILTHAFMGNFDEAGRQRLVGKWKELLSERGRIVTIQRVRSPSSPSVVRFSARQKADFVAAAIHATEREGAAHSFDVDAARQAAIEFSKGFSVHSIKSKSALEKLFLDAGLAFHHLEYRRLDQKDNLSGPSVPSGGEYAHVVAGMP